MEEDLIIGIASIMEALRLPNQMAIFAMVAAFGCPVKLAKESCSGKGGQDEVWTCNREKLDDWLTSRLSAKEPLPQVTTYASIREDLVVGQAEIIDLFKISIQYRIECDRWTLIEEVIALHRAPIARIGKRWNTRLSLLDEWLGDQLREAQ